MASEKTVLRQVREVNIAQCIIESNTGGDQKDIVDLITDFSYYESILEPSIRTTIVYADAGKSIKKDNKTLTVIDGLPLQGTESVKIKITDGNDVKLEFEQFVTQIVPVGQESTKSVVALDLVSEEGIINLTAAVNQRFDGKNSEHVKKILTDKKYLGTEKKLDIEETENNFCFIGNNKRSFYTILWLAKKSIPLLQGAKQNTAGYFFFETSEGFKFKSIDSLLSQEKKKSFIYNETPDGAGENIPSGYSAKILKFSVDDVGGDAQSKLEMGSYATRTILFDPFNCYYEVITKGIEQTEKNLKLAGKNLPVINPRFIREGKNKNFTRTQYMLIDRGTLPTGDTKQQITKSDQPNFDPENILSQSSMRYNQLFNITTTITIVPDFSLHAGDIIFIDFRELSDQKNEDLNKQFGGNYLIADLCHYINVLKGGYTKLTLVRDSLGKTGSFTND
jgi:hypothetical protein